jgi:thiol-disulfide isomerase/thioredoxin
MYQSFSWRLFTVVLGSVALLVSAAPTHAEVLPFGLKLEKVWDNALGVEVGDIATSPRDELWILERNTGTIRVIRAGLEEASLTIPVSTACESGLLDVAFDPGYASNGRALIYYVDPSNDARVDELFKSGSSLTLGGNVLAVGNTATGCRPGGGMTIGDDNKLYVAVGDLDQPGNAQDDGQLQGKILRAELDGTIPGDNASGTLVWAKGLRNGKDMAMRGGTPFVSDVGEPASVSDELNNLAEGGNYAWPTMHGNTGGAFDDPLVVEFNPTVDPEGLVSPSDALGRDYEDDLFYTCTAIDGGAANEIRHASLNGTGALLSTAPFYDPLGDDDGTPDAGCPKKFNALDEGGDGWLYAANIDPGTEPGATPGIWRVYNDAVGPREVSGPGSPFQMRMGKAAGADLEIGFENLGPLDAYYPSRNGGQFNRPYRILQGNIGSLPVYDHSELHVTSGSLDGPGRRTANFTPGGGDHYYLVQAQADNLSGSAGRASDGTERSAVEDYCQAIGYGGDEGDCAEMWMHPVTGEELRLKDWNPFSPTYLQNITLSDFRGKVIRIDYSATNCPPCQAQANVMHFVQEDFRDRDFIVISVMNLQYQTLTPIPPALCQSQIASWATVHQDVSPIVCDTDLDGNGLGDIIWQNWVNQGQGCGGVPQNRYIDQGHVVYDFVCGGETSVAGISARIAGEINPETCE